MTSWKHELEQVEAAALRIEELERVAEGRFDAAHARAEAANDPKAALDTPEFADWMAARAQTDEAWGRWAQVMHDRPKDG